MDFLNLLEFCQLTEMLTDFFDRPILEPEISDSQRLENTICHFDNCRQEMEIWCKNDVLHCQSDRKALLL